MMDADVLVVGGSLAGAAVALQLIREGATVILIEKDELPRRKPCGEGLSANGVDELRRLGFPLGSGFRPYHGYSVHRRSVTSHIPCLTDAKSDGRVCCSIEREALDLLFHEALAKHSNVNRIFGSRVRSLEQSEQYVAARLDGRTITARFAVLADGGSSPLGASLGLKSQSKSAPRIGGSIILDASEDTPLTRVQVFLEEGFQACLTPLANGKANLSFFGDQSFARELATRSFIGPLLTKIRHTTGVRAEPTGALRGVPIVSSRRRASFLKRVLLVGDSCEQFDPIAGMGMTHALLSARIAAAHLLRLLQYESNAAEILTSYAAGRERLARPFRAFTSLSYFSLVSAGGNSFCAAIDRSKLAARASAAINARFDAPSFGHSLLSAVGAFR